MTTPARGTHLFALDDGGILFSEPAQRFYGLNATAVLCWLALEDGLLGAAGIAELEAAGAPATEAESWWAQSVAMFRTEGFLSGSQPPPPDVPPAGVRGLVEGEGLARIPTSYTYRFYRLFDVLFRVGFPNQEALDRLSGMLARLAEPSASNADVEITVIEVGGCYLVARGTALVGVAPDLNGLAERLESALVLTAIDATPYLLSLHCGVLGRPGCGLLLPAPSGSGKTTLTTALAGHGWSFGTDEITLLDIDGRSIRTAPLSPCIKEGSWPVLAPYFPSLLDEPVHHRAGRNVRYLPLEGDVLPRSVVTHVVFPRYAANGDTALRPITRRDGLQRLLAECVSIPQAVNRERAERLVEWAGRLQFFDLSLVDLPAAIEAINGLAGPTANKKVS
ncbi:MAG: hypothetical protein QOK29_3363 [Rhodospirillaceae bacterium]|nr:hypothetical protein [Rhodospirillaceae bacterium]